MKVQKIKLQEHQFIWLVVDESGTFITPIQKYIQHLFCLDKSPYTIKSYAHNLKLYWEFLKKYNFQWHKVKINQIEAFASWLKRCHSSLAVREDSSMNTMLSAVIGFYEFHRRFSKISLQLIYQKRSFIQNYPSLLSHVKKNTLTKHRMIKFRPVKKIPKLISDETVKAMIHESLSIRDQFLTCIPRGLPRYL